MNNKNIIFSHTEMIINIIGIDFELNCSCIDNKGINYESCYLAFVIKYREMIK